MTRPLLPILAVLLGLSLLGNVYAVSRYAGDRVGRLAVAELSTRRFEPEFGRELRLDLIKHRDELQQAIAELRAARTRMFDLAARPVPDPEALAAATADVRTATARALSIFHGSIVDTARGRAAAK